MQHGAAILVTSSNNAKTGNVACTYVSIESSCPTSCPLKDEGCYAQSTMVAFSVKRTNAAGRTAMQAARDEAHLIRTAKVPRGRPMRLHVSGDCASEPAAREVGLAVETWHERGGGPVWSYTHAWRDVRRRFWFGVSVLASCDHPKQGRAALRRGYAPATIVASHPADGKAYVAHGVRWIPCPEQTRGIQCVECRLCWDADGLRQRKSGIAFAVHGGTKKRALRVLQETR